MSAVGIRAVSVRLKRASEDRRARVWRWHGVVRATSCAAALTWALAWAGPAFAHAFLKEAEPGVGSTLRAAPHQVAIGFTQDIEPLFSTIEVTDSAGHRFDAGDAHRGADAAHLVVGLGALTPGSYVVTWHATSVDTHKTEGHFTFTVGGS